MNIISDNFEKLRKVSERTAKVLICGNGNSAIGNLMKAMIEAQKDYEIELQFKENAISEEERLSTLVGTSFSEMIIDESTFAIPQTDISSLKKRIKYCKNPMEKKQLQQELNTLYKEQKRGK